MLKISSHRMSLKIMLLKLLLNRSGTKEFKGFNTIKFALKSGVFPSKRKLSAVHVMQHHREKYTAMGGWTIDNKACHPRGHYWDYYPGTLSFRWSHCNWFGDQAPVDEVYDLHMDCRDRVPEIAPATAVGWHALFQPETDRWTSNCLMLACLE